MVEFFRNMTFEFRLTIGTEWDNFFAKSQPMTLMSDLTKNI